MARIEDALLNSVVFVYRTEDSARTASSPGATGFIVEFGPCDDRPAPTYLVTSQHVVQNTDIFVRVSSANAAPAVHCVRAHEWWRHPAGDDVAIAPFEVRADWAGAPIPWLAARITHATIKDFNIGLGDEVILLGRYAHSQSEDPQPIARFGNISMMPGESVKDGRGLLVEAFLVEMSQSPASADLRSLY